MKSAKEVAKDFIEFWELKFSSGPLAKLLEDYANERERKLRMEIVEAACKESKAIEIIRSEGYAKGIEDAANVVGWLYFQALGQKEGADKYLITKIRALGNK
jgi:hypothetical protein